MSIDTTTQTQTPAPALSIAVADAVKALGFELAKGERVETAAIIVKVDGRYELRTQFGEPIELYTVGDCVASPGATAAPALTLRRKDGKLIANDATVEDAVKQVRTRVGYTVLQFFMLMSKSFITPKGSKSDKQQDRMLALRDLSVAGIRSK